MATGPRRRVGGFRSPSPPVRATRLDGPADTRANRSTRLVAVIVALAAMAAACGADEAAIAEGADGERSGVASMASVTFVDVATEVGLDFRHSAFRWDVGPDPMAMMGGGVCWIDHDNDGWLDLFVVDTWSEGEWGEWRGGDGIPTSHLFANDAGTFRDVSEETGAALALRGNGCVAADLDLDGWTDLFITTERSDVLLWNDGGEGFIDDATLDSPSGAGSYGWHTGAAVGDVDGNGWPDLFVAGYADPNRPIPSATRGFPNTFEPEHDLLLLNDGPSDGARVRFRNVAVDAGVEPAGPEYGLGVLMADLDLDGDLDVYVANDTTPNQLYENVTIEPGEVVLREQGVRAGVGDDGAGMGVAAADTSDDGLPDLVTTNQQDELDVLARNVTSPTGAGSLAFVDGRTDAGVADLGAGATGWGASWADVDLDGDPDLVIANGAIPVRDLDGDRQPLRIYENTGGGRLTDVSTQTGVAELGPYLGRGLAAADYDNDGDVDFAVSSVGGQLGLLRNTGAGGHWLTVSPTPAIPGTVVTVALADGRVLRRELAAGGSYLSSEDPRALFGLGPGTEVIEVVIEPPDGTRLRLDDVSVDRIVPAAITTDLDSGAGGRSHDDP